MRKIDALILRRTDERRRMVRERVKRILQDAKDRGVEISVIGSLARDRFRIHSDVDLLVHGPTDPARRSMVERLVAAHLRDTNIPYDLIFASDISSDRVQELLDEAV